MSKKVELFDYRDVVWVNECLGGNIWRNVAYNADHSKWVIDASEYGDGVGFYDDNQSAYDEVRHDRTLNTKTVAMFLCPSDMAVL